MAGGIYVETNGFSTSNDQSGTVIFDNGPPPEYRQLTFPASDN